MATHYIPLDNVKKALVASCNVGVFMRRAAISSLQPMGWTHKMIPAETCKLPENMATYNAPATH